MFLRKQLLMLFSADNPMGQRAIVMLGSRYTQWNLGASPHRSTCTHHLQKLARHVHKIIDTTKRQEGHTRGLHTTQTSRRAIGSNILNQQVVESYTYKLLYERQLLSISVTRGIAFFRGKQPFLRSNVNSTPSCDINPIQRSKKSSTPNPIPETIMFSKYLSRFMSTVSMRNTTGSGQPIPRNENLTSSSKGHKNIRINACAKLYKELAVTKPSLFGAAPKDRGIDFDLHYYDSWDLLEPNIRSHAPIVCLLHGAPGDYNDFDQLISHLTSKGVRVLAPNFPTYSATYKYSFRHSSRERLDYLMEFFRALDIGKIDMLIGHSSAIYTIFELLDTSLSKSTGSHRIEVNSLGLFSTPTYNLPRSMAVTPFRLFTLKLFDYPILRPFIIALITTFVKIQGIQNKVDPKRIENLLIAASAMGYSDYDKMENRLKLIREHNLPTLLLFGQNDRLIPNECFDQLKTDLAVDENTQVRLYGADGELARDMSNHNDLVQVSQFESGGHYVFQKYWRQVNQDVYNFLNKKVLEPKQVESTKL